MTHLEERGTKSGERSQWAPKLPEKPLNLNMSEVEPLYTTTLPELTSSYPVREKPKLKGILKTSTGESPRQLKGILKNGIERSRSPTHLRRGSLPSETVVPNEDSRNPLQRDIRDFKLNIKEDPCQLLDEGNTKVTGRSCPAPQTKKSNSNKRVSQNHPLTFSSKVSRPLELPQEGVHVTGLMERQTKAAAKIESMAGIAHLIVIIGCIIVLILLAQITNTWEVRIRRCPLYVKVPKQSRTHWGNEKLVSCHYAAYMPALILVMSLSLIILHGGVLYAWRNNTRTKVLLISRTYAKVLFIIEFLELLVAISVAGVLLDGIRQTCLGFQLNPWPNDRPGSCKLGYEDRDEVYGISKTYTKLLIAMTASWISVIMLSLTSILYLIRINSRCCQRNGSIKFHK